MITLKKLPKLGREWVLMAMQIPNEDFVFNHRGVDLSIRCDSKGVIECKINSSIVSQRYFVSICDKYGSGKL